MTRYNDLRTSGLGVRTVYGPPHGRRGGFWLVYIEVAESFEGISGYGDPVMALRDLDPGEKIAFVEYGVDMIDGIKAWIESIKEERAAREKKLEEPEDLWFCTVCNDHHLGYTEATKKEDLAGVCTRDVDGDDCGCPQRNPLT